MEAAESTRSVRKLERVVSENSIALQRNHLPVPTREPVALIIVAASQRGSALDVAGREARTVSIQARSNPQRQVFQVQHSLPFLIQGHSHVSAVGG